jgi:hypothetical protein
MSQKPAPVQRYLDRSGVKGPWQLSGQSQAGFSGAVVIPSLAEGESLFATLQSLSRNPPEWVARFLVVVVVNHGEEAAAEEKRQNQADLVRLAVFAEQTDLRLTWIDAVSPGQEIPVRQAGVGFARKLGLDLALNHLILNRQVGQEDPLLVCLDADTLVEKNYLSTVADHFRQSSCGATVLPYQHQAGNDAAQQAAIERYELFLRSYVYGLRLAGSPYAFNTVGSAMACRASAYVRCGGMNCRKAGEDFYFLQKLAKTDGVDLLSGTTVFPEPRVSRRVPFGTGRSVARLLEGDEQAVLFYPVGTFKILAAWLALVRDHLSSEADVLLSLAERISPVIVAFLEQAGWQKVWSQLQQNHQEETRRLKAFHVWFDGFKTMRLIHMLCDAGFDRLEPEQALPEYFALDDRTYCPVGVSRMLEELRLLDGCERIAS